MSSHFRILSHAFANHGLFLPVAIYFDAISPFMERPSRLDDAISRIESFSGWIRPLKAAHCLQYDSHHQDAHGYWYRWSVPRILEARAKGWPIGNCPPQVPYRNVRLHRSLVRCQRVLNGNLNPSVVRLVDTRLLRVHKELLRAFLHGNQSSRGALTWIIKRRTFSFHFIERALDLHWPMQFATDRRRFDEPEYKILGAIRQYKRIGVLRPSFVARWEKTRSLRRNIKKHISALHSSSSHARSHH
jgi:hypothetical protein